MCGQADGKRERADAAQELNAKHGKPPISSWRDDAFNEPTRACIRSAIKSFLLAHIGRNRAIARHACVQESRKPMAPLALCQSHFPKRQLRQRFRFRRDMSAKRISAEQAVQAETGGALARGRLFFRRVSGLSAKASQLMRRICFIGAEKAYSLGGREVAAACASWQKSQHGAGC